MKVFLDNVSYFFKETKTTIRLNWLSAIFTLISISLIFFIFASVISFWWISDQVIGKIQEEAEINVYLNEDIANIDEEIIKQITNVKGVREVKIVNEEEAYNRMSDVLGKEVGILKFFDDNPFSSFIELKINIDEIDEVIESLNAITYIEYVRGNREILKRTDNIGKSLKFIMYLAMVIMAVSVTMIISYVVRLRMYKNKEQANSEVLASSSKLFMSFPYLLEGLLLTVSSGLLAIGGVILAIRYLYAQAKGPLPFIPLPPLETLTLNISIILIITSIVLGIAGSFVGFVTSKNE